MSTEWHLDSLAHAGDEHLDEAFVAGYDAKQQADPAEDVQTLLDLGVDGTTTVVDLGTGTGTFAVAIAPHVGRVVAVDVSPVMVSYLRQRIAAAGLDNVRVVEAGFLSYRHDGAPAAELSRGAAGSPGGERAPRNGEEVRVSVRQPGRRIGA